MNILMVVTDVEFPYITGGARRTLETARILSELGHNIIIFCNRGIGQSGYSEYSGFKIYRKRMPEIGAALRGLIRPFRRLIDRLGGKNSAPTEEHVSAFEDHTKYTYGGGFKGTLKEFYRHILPFHQAARFLIGLPALLKIIRKEKIDLIYERGPSYGIGVLAARITGRISLVDFIDIRYWKWALKHSDIILSYFTDRHIPAYIPREKIVVVYTAADDRRFRPDIDGSRVRRQLGLKKDDFVGMYIGGFYSWHGLEYLVDAAEILINNPPPEFGSEKIKFVLVGKGEMFNKIKEMIKNKGLENHFILTGRIPFDTVPEYVAAADYCLSVNTGDPMGLKIFEYMACGRPVIITEGDTVREYFTDGKNALIIKPGDGEAIARKIVELIKDPASAEKIGQNARRLIEEKFNWRIHGRNIIKAYRTAALKRHKAK